MDWEAIIGVCALIGLVGGFGAWVTSYAASKEWAKALNLKLNKIEADLGQMKENQDALFSNQAEDRVERKKTLQVLESVDELFRDLQATGRFNRESELRKSL